MREENKNEKKPWWIQPQNAPWYHWAQAAVVKENRNASDKVRKTKEGWGR